MPPFKNSLSKQKKGNGRKRVAVFLTIAKI